MASLDFPSSPTPGQTYISGGRTWVWDGTSWNGTAAVTISGPSGPTGATGATGDSGVSGYSGRSGYSGTSGYSGSGISGYSGTIGYSGFSGYSGIGTSGYSGLSGKAGIGLTAGSTSVGYINYNGTTKAAGQMDGGSTAPTNTTRLNYDGYLYATKFYGDGSSLSGVSAGATLSAASSPVTYYLGLTASTSGTWTDARVDTSNLYYTSGNSTLYATNYNSASDANLKDDISTILNSTGIVEQLRGVKFKWRDTGEYSYGVIAQEVETVLPEIVNTVNGQKSVNYSALVGVLIESMKQVVSENQILSNRIDDLEQRIITLTAK